MPASTGSKQVPSEKQIGSDKLVLNESEIPSWFGMRKFVRMS